jgi:DNA-binding Lrp family transcriptional regulator
MNELDDKILQKLNKNAWKSYSEIARELNVSLILRALEYHFHKIFLPIKWAVKSPSPRSYLPKKKVIRVS